MKTDNPTRRRKAWIVLVLGTVAIAGGLWFAMRQSGTPHKHDAGQAVRYHCPMHPTVVSDKPGDCPICGMRLVPMEQEPNAPPAIAKKRMYRSTMNPNEISDKPGKDSMGMEMEPFEVSQGGPSLVPGLAVVTITPEARQRMGLTLGTVERRAMERTLRTSARIVADETRLFQVTTKVEGWVDKLQVSVTGQAVRKGDPLLAIYSPQLVSAQQEYLVAVQAGAKALVSSARQRLQLWDVSDEQIARLEKTGQVERTLTLYAPASGFVTDKQVLAGQKIGPGDSLMVVTDLSAVWGDADIYESDLPYVRIGMPIELTLPYWPDKTFQGKVSFLSPGLDPQTRTLKARLEIPNPDLMLRPEMYATAWLRYDLGEPLSVPTAAVMFTGTRVVAFRDGGEGRLVPVELKLGARSGDDYVVLAGLNAGDQVVVSANFLVDSESSMKAALESLTGDRAAPAAHAGH